jgi:hypothetical protein
MNALRITAVVLLNLAATLAAPAYARASDAPVTSLSAGAPTVPMPEVTLAFARRNIWNWEADGQKGIWVEDLGHHWYYGKFMAPCIDLPFREGVAFRFGPAGELDKFGGLDMPHFGPCNFISFTRSDGPPHAKKPGKASPAASAPAAVSPGVQQ